MKRFLVTIIAAGALSVLIFSFLNVYVFSKLEVPSEELSQTYDSDTLGIRFTYPGNYRLEERDLSDGHRAHISLVLTEDTEENRRILDGDIPTEGPPAITLDFYQNPEGYDPVTWMQGDSRSNFKLSNGAYKQVTFAGKEGVFYQWDGLYRADNVVVSHRDLMLSMAVTYINSGDRIRSVFNDILGSLAFEDAQSATPLFEDHPVSESERFDGDPAPVDLASDPIGPEFKTRLTEGAKNGPNFAGHFTVVEWGCGTMCAQFAIIDARTGQIYSIPWGVQTGLEYRLDSTLLVLNPIKNTREAYPDSTMVPAWLSTNYYDWDGTTLNFIKAFRVVENGILETDIQ